MKLLLVLMLLGSPALADQGSDALVTGFVNGFSQARYGQQYSPNAQQVNVTTRQIPQNQYHQEPHYDAVTNDGRLGEMFFATYGSCRRYIANSAAFVDCEMVR